MRVGAPFGRARTTFHIRSFQGADLALSAAARVVELCQKASPREEVLEAVCVDLYLKSFKFCAKSGWGGGVWGVRERETRLGLLPASSCGAQYSPYYCS